MEKCRKVLNWLRAISVVFMAFRTEVNSDTPTDTSFHALYSQTHRILLALAQHVLLVSARHNILVLARHNKRVSAR